MQRVLLQSYLAAANSLEVRIKSLKSHYWPRICETQRGRCCRSSLNFSTDWVSLKSRWVCGRHRPLIPPWTGSQLYSITYDLVSIRIWNLSVLRLLPFNGLSGRKVRLMCWVGGDVWHLCMWESKINVLKAFLSDISIYWIYLYKAVMYLLSPSLVSPILITFSYSWYKSFII